MYKNLFLIGFIIIININTCFGNSILGCQRYYYDSESIILYKELINKIEYNRAVVDNALNLSDEQIKKKEEIVMCNKKFYDDKFNDLLKECCRLQVLSSSNVSMIDICKQKKIIKNIEREIQCKFEEESRSFEKILSRQQKAKYSMIKKLERNEYKKASYNKDYYKSNPNLKQFGNPNLCDKPE